MTMPPYERIESLPGVGPSIAAHYRRLGITSTDAIATTKPEDLFDRLEQLDGPTDRCVLYVFRCARYAVRTAEPDRELLNWCRCKDEQLHGMS